MAEKTRRRRSPCACTCGGCAGVLLLGLVVFAIVYASVGNRRYDVPPPAPMPVPNGYDDYVAAARMLQANGGTKGMYGTKPGQETTPALALEEVVTARNAPAMARMRQAFGKECRAPEMRTAAHTMPELAGIRDLARLLSADADVRRARGDHAGALSDGLDTIEMGLDVRRGGVFIHGLVGIACEAIAHASMLQSVEHVPPADARRLAGRMEKILVRRAPYADTLAAEQNFERCMIGEIDRSPSGLLWVTSQGADPSAGDASVVPVGVRNVAGRIGWRFMRDRTIAELERYLPATLAEARKPVPEPTSSIAAILVPVFAQASAKFDLIDARSRLLLVVLAIRAYRGEHGALPKSLADLGLDPRLTSDPYSGKPLVYRPKDGDYLLYSVGPDFKDDGGVPANEDGQSVLGDLGVSMFRYNPQGSTQTQRYYRRVPHMLPPNLPPGAPALNP